MSAEGQDYAVAVVIATEVPPTPTGAFTADMIPVAIRAVADVIRNRVASGTWGDTAVEVVLAPRQFSAVCGHDSSDYWRRAMAGKWCPAHVAACLAEWRAARPPIAAGALYYYSPVSMKPPGSVPAWAPSKTEVFVPGLDRGFFRFFK